MSGMSTDKYQDHSTYRSWEDLGIRPPPPYHSFATTHQVRKQDRKPAMLPLVDGSGHVEAEYIGNGHWCYSHPRRPLTRDELEESLEHLRKMRDAGVLTDSQIRELQEWAASERERIQNAERMAGTPAEPEAVEAAER